MGRSVVPNYYIQKCGAIDLNYYIQYCDAIDLNYYIHNCDYRSKVHKCYINFQDRIDFELSQHLGLWFDLTNLDTFFVVLDMNTNSNCNIFNFFCWRSCNFLDYCLYDF